MEGIRAFCQTVQYRYKGMEVMTLLHENMELEKGDKYLTDSPCMRPIKKFLHARFGHWYKENIVIAMALHGRHVATRYECRWCGDTLIYRVPPLPMPKR